MDNSMILLSFLFLLVFQLLLSPSFADDICILKSEEVFESLRSRWDVNFKLDRDIWEDSCFITEGSLTPASVFVLK